jgi:soluble lytic murein transglycosylase-like protein
MKTIITVAGLAATLALSAAAARAEGANDPINWQNAALRASADPAGEPAATGPISRDGPGNAAAVAEKPARRSGSLGYESGERGRYRDLIARHAAANGVPFGLADAVVRIESRYNPGVRHGGAVGLMQIKPQTARGLGYGGGAAGLLHPETNLRWGMLYLAQAYRMSKGDTCATVMRYQSGHGATRMSGANRVYCAKARTIMASLR